MTLSKAVLPSTIEVGGKAYRIKTDFRFILLFLKRVKENALIAELDFIYSLEKPADRAAGIKAILEWINPKRELPRNTGGSNSETLLDYEIDAELIFASFWEAYGIDLFDPDLRLHWYKFQALLLGLHNTRLNDIMSYRAWKPTKNCGKEYKREMSRLKEAWRIETPLTQEEQDAIARFDAAVEASKRG